MKNCKVEIKSILREVVKEVELETDLYRAIKLVDFRVRQSKINEQDRNKILLDIWRCKNKISLVKYIWNAILKYEGDGVIKESLNGTKLK